MYATTVVNSDNSFSPAVLWQQSLWVFPNRKGEQGYMLKVAQANVADIQRRIGNELEELGYVREQ